ncbi:hypothetical protein [Legionella israelensis]|uniref:Uncharacterized protein n=1 Tax=Legionella israelensis TaxID=454 RepID=A0A0W0VIS6_9GAMM|nr:hypothetical protein [Legionella israelensis]KTD20017.1 hypothetical protein Lisr_1867 [Legionella israelensis]SCY45140.1 hypothetical protein SAMN02746069_02498 [Legionella israelensis DSM 19235]STX59965.1 Uncharacterised protein [Legionella israelensis]
MRKVFRLLGVVLDAITDIMDEKPKRQYMPVYEAREKFEKGMISVREYNETFENNNGI